MDNFKYQLADLAEELDIEKTKLFYQIKKYSKELEGHIHKNETSQTAPILLDEEGYDFLLNKLKSTVSNLNKNKKGYTLAKRVVDEKAKAEKKISELLEENRELKKENEILTYKVGMLEGQLKEKDKFINILEETNKGSLYAINTAQISIGKQIDHLIAINEKKGIFSRLLPKRDNKQSEIIDENRTL